MSEDKAKIESMKWIQTKGPVTPMVGVEDPTRKIHVDLIPGTYVFKEDVDRYWNKLETKLKKPTIKEKFYELIIVVLETILAKMDKNDKHTDKFYKRIGHDRS